MFIRGFFIQEGLLICAQYGVSHLLSQVLCCLEMLTLCRQACGAEAEISQVDFNDL